MTRNTNFNPHILLLQGYAGSEEVLGYCLRGRRQDAVIATKYGFRVGIDTPAYSASDIDQTVTNALRRLETDYIDLLQVFLLWWLLGFCCLSIYISHLSKVSQFRKSVKHRTCVYLVVHEINILLFVYSCALRH